MWSLIKKTSKSGGEMIEIFNHLFLYAIIDTERGVEVDELRKIMGLGNGYKVIKIEECEEGKVKAKYIYVETKSIKCKCPKCGKYTKSIHDRLKPVKLKYVKAFEQIAYVMLSKKRFICHKCNYKFTEPVTIQGENKNISNKTVQKILIDLRNYNLSLKYIAEEGKNVYINEKTEQWLIRRGLQLPTRFTTDSVSYNNNSTNSSQSQIAPLPLNNMQNNQNNIQSVEIPMAQNIQMVEILKYDLREKILSISEEYKIAYQLKELFLDITHHATYEDVEKQLLNWISLVKEQDISEMVEAASTIENWLEYICNSFIDKRFSNGYTEGINNKIKVIKRVGFGYKDFNFFKIRLLYILNDKNNKK